jgi:hypothetical protein
MTESGPTDPAWKVFSLTYIEYPEGDHIGKALSVLSLAPLVIVVASISVFAVKRDLHTLAYGAGMIANGIVSLQPFLIPLGIHI